MALPEVSYFHSACQGELRTQGFQAVDVHRHSVSSQSYNSNFLGFLKALVPILFAALLLASCIGHRQVTTYRPNTLDCELLAKKQRQQFKKAMAQAKSVQRRKPLNSKPLNVRQKEQQVTAAASGEEYFTATEQIIIRPVPAYSQSLALPKSMKDLPESIRQKELTPKVSPSSTQRAIPSGNGPTARFFEKFTNDVWIWPAILLGGAIGMSAMTVFQTRTKAVSRWAKDHKWKARSILVVTKIGSAFGCLVLGNELYDSSIAVPEFVKLSALVTLVSAFAFYPSKYFPSGAPAFGFLERKFYDASIFTAGAIVLLYAGNHFDVTLKRVDPIQTVASVALPDKIGGGLQKKISVVKREFKQKIKAVLQNPPKEMTSGEKTTLTILAVLAAVVLTFGVAALSCSLSCNGQEAASVFVFVGGVGLIVWALVATIRSIHNRPTKKRVASVKSAA